ncbi:MAG: filamentous hemagglutinin N-terminal domain-containing protein [Acholeplasmataceae bacterium]|nr:filamentous hemagglutinin N-terminal domain-containing protein [Acholeplasmataceae bacterium]
MQIAKNRNKLALRVTLSLLIGTSLYLGSVSTTFAVPGINELPTGGTVVVGSATITNPSTGRMNINQGATTPYALINWEKFNIGANASVNITQHQSSDVLVNNVVSNNLSEIYGKLNATGNVVLINPNGVLFSGAKVNVGGFVASTAKLADETATSFPGFATDGTVQGNIDVTNSTIKAGIGAVIANTSALSLPSDYAIGLGVFNDEIRLIANGNVNINAGTTLQAVDQTTVTTENTLGVEEYSVADSTSTSRSRVLLRSDANADDYGTVTMNGNPVINTSTLAIYYNPEIKEIATTQDGVQYSKKDYTKEQNFSGQYTSNATTGKLISADAGQTYAQATQTARSVAAVNADAYMLVNNIAQLQDISDANTGNLNGKYALGKDINATGDTAAFYDQTNGILYRSDKNGNIVAVSTSDGGTFTDATTKVIAGKTITNTGSTISDGTYNYNGSTTSDSTYTLATDGSITSSVYNRDATGNVIIRNSDGTTISGNTVNTAGNTYSISGNSVTTNGEMYNITASTVTTVQGGITYTITGSTVTGVDASNNPVTIPSDTQTQLLGLASSVKDAQSTYTSAQTVNTAMNTFATGANAAKPALATALTQFNALNTTAINQPAKSIDSSKWNDNKGFNPIGDADTGKAFKGSFDGYDGDAVHGISNLTIKRTDEDNVGLFGVTDGSSLRRVILNNAVIEGQSNVGALVGQMKGTTVSSSATYGGSVTSTTAGSANIGGLVGLATDASNINSAYNSAAVTGKNDDGSVNISNVGGIVGHLDNSNVSSVINAGTIYGEKSTGGLVGNVNNDTMPTNTKTLANSYNKGQVSGIDNTGGIAGEATNASFDTVYNTNEASTLSGNLAALNTGNAAIKAYYVGSQNQSKSGKITGTGQNTGGLVGLAENTTIDKAYNAGNVTGTTNTGGLVGQMTGASGKITNAYNADNNTVIRETFASGLPDAVKNITSSSNVTEEDVRYYSFYSVDSSGNPTYYYFIPTLENGTVGKSDTQGAKGYYVLADGSIVNPDNSTNNTNYVPAEDRYYMNRMGYLDANVTGIENTGGLVGNMTNGMIDTTYNAGTVTGTAASSGGLVGTMSGGTLKNSFYVTGTDASTGKEFSGQTKAVGNQISGTVASNIKSEGQDIKLMRQGTNVKSLGDNATNNTNWIGIIQDTTQGGLYVYTTTPTDVDAIINGSTVRYFTPDEGLFTLAANGNHVAILQPVEGTTDKFKSLENGKTYTLTTDGSGTNTFKADGEADITIYKRMVSSNQGDNWLIYENSSLPLLQAYLNNTGLDRVFEYDGTTHNLVTQDVDHLYGRADFNDGAGKNVWTDGYTESGEHPGSSQYRYDRSSIWSPQHAYQIDPKAQIVILPKDMTVTVTGNKTYGNYALTGYYVAVGSNYYKVIDTNDLVTYPDGYYYEKVILTNGETIAAKANAEGKYLVTINGFMQGEGILTDGQTKDVMSGLVTMMKNSTEGNNFVYEDISNGTKDTLQLDAGNYNFSSGSLGGLEADHRNYNISYAGQETIGKANLYYTVDGVRDYGKTNLDRNGEYKFTLVGIDDAVGTNGAYTSTEGYLKAWDQDKLVGMTANDVTAFLNKNGLTYSIQGKADGGSVITIDNKTHVIVDSTGKVTSYDVTSFGPNPAFNSAALSKNYNLVWKAENANTTLKTNTAQNTFGTTAATVAKSTMTLKPVDLNVTINGERNYGDNMSTSDSIIYASTASDGKWAVNANGYASNSRDNSSTVINKTVLQSLLNLVEGLPENTLNKIDATTFVKRDGSGNVTVYDLKAGTEYTGSLIDVATLFTKTDGNDNRTVVFDPSATNNQILNSAYKYDYLVKNGNHSLKIKPIDLTILTNGSKIYGQNNDDIAYGYTYNGLKDFDTDDHDTYLKNNTTYTSSPDSRITSTSDAGVYGTQNGDGQKAINTTIQNTGSTEYNNIANNYNIKFADTLTINKRQLTVNTEGSKTYGSANPTTGFTYTSNTGTADNTTGLMTWDNTLLQNSTTVVEGLDERSNAGVYGTEGSQIPNNKVLNTTTVANLNKNYDITHTDKFTINKKDLTYAYTGTREYGRDNATGSYNNPIFNGLTAWDSATSADYTLSNEAERTTNVGTHSDKLKVELTGDVFKNYNISGTTALEITKADFTYVADHTEYWQGQQIPAQTGRVFNSHGEDVSDLVGSVAWMTSATRYSSPGYYEIIGSGSADNSGNYNVFQYGNTGAYSDFEPAFTDARDNFTALKIKANQTLNYGEIYGSWGNYRKPQLDIRYLTSKSTEGINRDWSDSAQDKGTFTFISNSQKK